MGTEDNKTTTEIVDLENKFKEISGTVDVKTTSSGGLVAQLAELESIRGRATENLSSIKDRVRKDLENLKSAKEATEKDIAKTKDLEKIIEKITLEVEKIKTLLETEKGVSDEIHALSEEIKL